MEISTQQNKGYKSLLTKRATEEAIEYVKTLFPALLAEKLKLIKVSAPIAVLDGTGINDDLNGIERSVTFPIKALQNQKAVIVNSLAKWKRFRLYELGIAEGTGIYTDMRALRPDEDLSPIHSVYVDQWDWEQHITAEKRTVSYLKQTVKSIYAALKEMEHLVAERFKEISVVLPHEIKFIHVEDLLREYPTLTAKERERKAARQYGAVFLIGIGGHLSNGESHDGRAPDYDDWSTETTNGYRGLNGDIIVWNPVLKDTFEISSMGIRVDKAVLLAQLAQCKCEERAELFFHKTLLNGQLPESIGGGIGQSRVCMFMLRKAHIGEVQVGIWPESLRTTCFLAGIDLL